MPVIALRERPSVREIAGALNGLYRANLAILAEGFQVSLQDVRQCRYRKEKPDVWSVLPRFLARKEGDCEEFLTSAGAILAFSEPWKEVHGWLAPAGGVTFHCFLTVQNEIYDTAVEFGGMERAPRWVYEHKNRVMIW